MASRSVLHGEADGTVTIRLSEIPSELREKVAGELAIAWERHGVGPDAWLALRLAALNPTGKRDVKLQVPAWKADLVLRGKRPNGQTPKELLW